MGKMPEAQNFLIPPRKCAYGRAPKGVQFSAWDGGIFHCTNSGRGSNFTCLKRGPCLSGKGLLSYLCLELEYHK